MKQLSILIFLFFSTSVIAQDTVQFSRAKTYERLTISKDAFSKLVRSLKYYHHENPPDSVEIYRNHSISCKVGRNNESQTSNGFSQIEKMEFDGKDYTSLDITYLNSHQPISSIYLTFASYDRRVSISGTDQQKVNALFRELDEQITASEDFLGFVNWTAVLTATLFCLFMLAQFIFFQIKPIGNDEGASKQVKMIKGICVLFIVVCIVYFLSPYKLDDIFPGFVLTGDESHWWDKYGNFIGVFAFLVPTCWGFVKFLGKIIVSAATPIPVVTPQEEPGESSLDQNNL